MKKRLRQHMEPHQVLLSRRNTKPRGQLYKRRGAGKKTKAHRMPPKYMVTEDEVYLVAQMVQDRTMEDFEDGECQRDRIQEEMAYMRQIL
jgi:hypothetical protein